MRDQQIVNRKVHFRPRARMVKILGEHLIRDNTVGLMELVKNGYDADARLVRIELQNIRNADKTIIIVQDDGHGMTEDIIRGPWFEPAHGVKENLKASQTRSAMGRLPLGEKGVGRFAAQKLGRYLELVTRPVGGQSEFVVLIDWLEFEGTDRYIDEIEIPIISRSPEIFRGDSHGTRLKMLGARQPWTRRDLQRFQASLIRLLSPRKGVENFRVELLCPEFPDLESLDYYDILEKYQYRIDCIIDEHGMIQYDYRQRLPDGTEEKRSDERNLWAQVNPDGWTERDPACGAFLVQLSAWLLKANLLEKYGLNRDHLRTLGGVSIYRDGFRILPYGDEGDDWLGLDQRRINVPAERFGNRQVIGIVEIDQISNQGLIDKTNREGLQENQAYHDLRSIVLGVINLLEQESLEHRRTAKEQSVSRRDLEATIEDLKQEIKNLRQESIEEPGLGDEEQLVTPEEMVLVSKEKLDELEEQAQYISEAVSEIYQSQEEERETFLHLLGIGLAAERFTHEFDRLVDNSIRCIQVLKSGQGVNRENLDRLDMFVNVLRNEIRLMGTLRYVRQSQRARNHSVRRIVELVFLAHDEAIKQAHIRPDLRLNDDFIVNMSEASLAQVIDNIIHNAVYWLKQKAEIHDRRLRIELVSEEKSIIISNNGPAILPTIRRNLFKLPFITAKPEGRGLGMYIAAEIIKKYGGVITTMDEDDERVLDGAAFMIKLSKTAPNMADSA